MCVCTFFGHKDCPDSIKERLWETLKELIVNHHVDMFYVGNKDDSTRLCVAFCGS